MYKDLASSQQSGFLGLLHVVLLDEAKDLVEVGLLLGALLAPLMQLNSVKDTE